MKLRKHLKRPIRFIELWTTNQWKIKIYYITEFGMELDESFITIAKNIAENEIAKITPSHNHHHSAFLTIHISGPFVFNQIIFDWWAEENELRHLVFKAEPNDPKNFVNITSTGKAFCIWELKIIGFERDSWMENILLNENPSLEKYYSDVLNIDE